MKKQANKDPGHVNKCQICKSGDLKLVLSLGHHPVPQEYLTLNMLHESESTYPLNVVFCNKCKLVQLDYVIDPKVVFPPRYPYRTGLTKMLINNFQSLSDTLNKLGYLKPKSLVVDIGSNDGTLLKPFKEKGMRVVGVEPTGAAKVANANGIPTINSFLSAKVVAGIIKKYGRAEVVTATNVFAHINDAGGLVKNIKNLLAKDGLFVSESQYLSDIIEKVEFDTVYHEHLRFYSLRPIKTMLEKEGFSIIDAERISAAGGSIRVFAKKGKHPMSDKALSIIAEEEKAGLYDFASYQNFAKRILDAKYELVSMILKLKKDGSRIVGITSSCRSNTLLSFMKITNDILDYTGEKHGSPKIGMYTPGTHIPVVDEERIIKEQPEYLLVLSWHIGKDLIEVMKKKGYKGKFILPLPVPTIID